MQVEDRAKSKQTPREQGFFEEVITALLNLKVQVQ